jgi:hypothetical protein
MIAEDPRRGYNAVLRLATEFRTPTPRDGGAHDVRKNSWILQLDALLAGQAATQIPRSRQFENFAMASHPRLRSARAISTRPRV